MMKTSEKTAVYEILGNLNQHFEQVLLNLQRLRRLRVVESRDLKDLLVFVEEARAWANSGIVSALQMQEETDWAGFNRLRILSERSLRRRSDHERASGKGAATAEKDSKR